MKQCRKCDYGDCGDMCRYWRIWKKEVPLKYCSEEFAKECKESGAIKSNVFEGTRIIDRELLEKILLKHFPKLIKGATS